MEAEHFEPYSSLAPQLFNNDVAGKSVLITGAGYGIGSSIAKAFAQASAKEVVLVGRTKSRLETTASDLKKEFSSTKFTVITADVTSTADVASLFDSIAGPVDILINNAGFLSTPTNFLDADLKEYWESFNVNVWGMILVTQSFLKHREAHKAADASPAVVITVNTIVAFTVRVPKLSAYAASKTAAARMSELIQEDVPTTSARFISIYPGAVKTAMGEKSGTSGRIPSTNPQLTAEFIVWASTEESSFLAGRMAWVNWDKDKLLAKKDEIVRADSLRSNLEGAAFIFRQKDSG